MNFQTEQEKYEQIEAYINGTLDLAEQEKIRDLMAADAAFRDEVKLHKDLAQEFSGEKQTQFRDTLGKVHQQWKGGQKERELEVKRSAPVFELNRWNKWGVAASIALLLGVTMWFWSLGQPIDNRQLFVDNYQPYEMVLSQRSNGENVPLAQKAIQSYTSGDYKNSISQWTLWIEEDADQAILKLYRGISALEIGDFEQAISDFQTTRSVENLEQQSQWFLALTFLAKGDTEKAKDSFQWIEQGQYMYSEAQFILNQL